MTIQQVVAGVMIYEHRVCLTQRLPAQAQPFMWESPGGGVEPNESLFEALDRELFQELGLLKVDYIVGPRVWSGVVQCSPTKEVHITFQRVDMSPDLVQLYRIRPQEGQGFGWFTVQGMTALDLTPGNRAAMLPICQAINARI